MREVSRMLAAALAACAAFLALFFALRWHIAVCALLAVGVYFGLYFLLKPVRRIAGIAVENLPGGEEMQALLEEARQDLDRIRQAEARIDDPAVRRDAQALRETGERILAYLHKNPEKIRSAHQFLTYTLDTAGKLLARYDEFRATGLATPEVQEILERTAKSLPVLHAAFERQFTRLMQGELLDVEADIELLRKMLAMEGEQP